MRGAVCVLVGVLGCASTTGAERADARPDADAVDARDAARPTPGRFAVRVESLDWLGVSRPLPGAAVALDGAPDARRIVLADADGMADFSDVSEGLIDVTVANRGHIARSLLGVAVRAEVLTVQLERIDLPPSRTVRGEVRGLLAPDDDVLVTVSTYGERLLAAPTRYEMEIPAEADGIMVAGLVSHDRTRAARWLRFDFSTTDALRDPVDLDFAGETLPSVRVRAVVALENPPAPLTSARVDCGVTGARATRSTLALGSFAREASTRPDEARGVLDYLALYPSALAAQRLTRFCRAIYPTNVAAAPGAFSMRYAPGDPDGAELRVTLPPMPPSLPSGLRSGSAFTVPSDLVNARYNVRVIGFPGVRTWEIELAAGARTGRIPALPSAMLASSILSDGPTAQLTACVGPRNDPSCLALSGSARTRFNR